MTAWVLVVLLYGTAPAAIPGIASEAACYALSDALVGVPEECPGCLVHPKHWGKCYPYEAAR